MSISLPESIYQQFESLVDQRGFRSRSHAVAEMISSTVADTGDFGDHVLSATLTICYDHTIESVGKELTALRQRYSSTIVSSFHALVGERQSVEVLLLNGPASSFSELVDAHVTLRGVRTGKLAVVSL